MARTLRHDLHEVSLRPDQVVRAEGKQRNRLLRPLPEVCEYLRRRIPIERELADVANHSDDFPRDAVPGRLDKLPDDVLAGKRASSHRLVDEDRARLAVAVVVIEWPSLDHWNAHDGQIVLAHHAKIGPKDGRRVVWLWRLRRLWRSTE